MTGFGSVDSLADDESLETQLQWRSAELQIAGIAYSDSDLNGALRQCLETICRVFGSQTGLLFLKSPDEARNTSYRKQPAVISGLRLRESLDELCQGCSHGIALWRGWVYDLLQSSPELHTLPVISMLADDERFVAMSLVANNVELGRVAISLAPARELTDHEVARFCSLLELAAQGVERVRTFEEARRRCDNAEALYEATCEISLQAELDDVASAIVRQARYLVGTDYTSLELLDDDGAELYVRASDGVRREERKALRLSLGEGMAGFVATFREPVVTSDIYADPRFPHGRTPIRRSLDGGVSCIAVPLMIRNSVVGVLLAANRRASYFTPVQVKLMVALGNAAVAALERAKLYAGRREEIVRLERRCQESAGQTENLLRMIDVHKQFLSLALGGFGLDQMAQLLANLISNPVMVEDYRFQRVAEAFPTGLAPAAEGSLLEAIPQSALRNPEVAASIRRLSETGRATRVSSLAGRGCDVPRVMAAMVVRREVLGYVSAVERYGSVAPADCELIEVAAAVIAMEMARQKAAFEVGCA